jgi:hypothetical protein
MPGLPGAAHLNKKWLKSTLHILPLPANEPPSPLGDFDKNEIE